ncbi:MAG TPA: adenylate/guanylate cyclase domain-containing protein [Candidatus Binatia bacterium]|nr:adenylate/guanylate cyclase domain-containing protein [Candidatus Binatia bacterium]
MRCVNCGTELIAGKAFCHACGARAPHACPQCGNTVQAGFRFCPDCGFQLGNGAPESAPLPVVVAEPPRAVDRFDRLAKHIPQELVEKIRAGTGAVAGERKLVTVLFCDLVGSTAIAERLDPEEYHDLLEDYLALAFAEIYRFDGIVNQLAGDGMMALFGAPIAHEDAPQRAVRAAVAIRDAITRFNQSASARHAVELRIRVGIHTGPVVVGTVGNDLKMDYTAIGDTTNLASRMQSLAQPGSILISEATYRRVRGMFQLQPAGTFEVKGKSEPVAAYEALGVGDAVTPMSIAAARGLTPFVGRDNEIAQLMSCFERLEGHLAQVITVVGHAGSGKSRLLYEFKRRVQESDDAVVFEARCSSLSRLHPYAPWISMLKQHFGLTHGDSNDSACEKVAQHVRRWDPDLNRLYPFLCHMLSVRVDAVADLSADEMTRQTFEAMSHLIGGISHQAPVVMLFEDLHWIDDASRDMLELAVTRIDKARVMLVMSHRPDYQPTWRTHAAFTQLNLRGLSDNDVRAIIRAVAGGVLPGELEQLIQIKAEGNPFFAEEITRALVEEGDVVRSNGHLQLARPAEQIRIPGTVEEVIGARVDRFGPQAKRVLQVAAVFGRQFRRSALLRVLDGEAIDVTGQLDELERRGVIHRKNMLSADEYRFGESLTQEVAYEGLLLKERRQLHERIAQALEAEPGEATSDRAALLAHHYARGESRGKAVGALLEAARRAEQLPSFQTAFDFYRQAWELVTTALNESTAPGEPLQRSATDVAIGLGRMAVLYNVAQDDVTEPAVRRGREIAESLGDPKVQSSLDTYYGMLIMSGERHRFAEGLAIVEQGLATAQRAGLTENALSVSRGLAYSYIFDGRFALAHQMFDWVMQQLEHSDHRERLSDLYLGGRFLQATMRFVCDDFDDAIVGLRNVYELAVRVSNRTVRCGSSANLAWVYCLKGDYVSAEEWAERSLEVAEAISNIGAKRGAGCVLLIARTQLGQPVSAARYVGLIETQLAAVGDFALKINLFVDALLSAGEIKRAWRLADLVHTHAGGRLREAMCEVALGDILQRAGADHWTDAQRWYDHAIGLAEIIGARSTLALGSLGAGTLALARGDHATAQRQLGRADRLCREVGLGHYLPRVEQALAQLNPRAEAVA